MRKLLFLFAIPSLIAFLFFACKGATTPPEFKFQGGLGYTTTNTTSSNANVIVGIRASKGGTRLKAVDISHIDAGGTSYTDTTIIITDVALQKEYSYDYTITPPSPYVTGDATWTFTVTDQHGNNVTRTITITYL